jgi:hypothetical protein
MPAVNREDWLSHALVMVNNHLQTTANAFVPPLTRVSVGFPGGRGGASQKAIGQCWDASCSADEHYEIFISPTLADPISVLAVLVHEAIHAAVGLKHGHKAPFKRVAVAAGLEGKMTATVAGAALTETLAGWLDALGIYPHGTLSLNAGTKKQSTRLIKCDCDQCGYTLRVTKKWLEFSGAPFCPTDSCRDTDTDMPHRMTATVTETEGEDA